MGRQQLISVSNFPHSAISESQYHNIMLQAAIVAAILGGTLAYIVVVRRRVNEGERKRIEKHGNDGDEPGDCSDQLIPQIGRELSIECLIRSSRSCYGSVAMINHSFRSLIRSGILYKLRRNHGIIESWVYFSCEIPNWEAFDPERRRWIRVPRLNANDYCFISSDKESQAVGTQLLVLGKGVYEQIIYKYDLLTNSWSFGMKLKHPRCLFASASLGEIAIFAGGSNIDQDRSIVGCVEMYKSDTGTWHELPSLRIPRKLAAGVFLDGKFWVIGGVATDSGGEVITTAEVFDLGSNTWTVMPHMHPPLGSSYARSSAPPLLAVVKNELYAANHYGMELWKYSTRYKSWRKIGMLPPRVSSLRGWGIAFRGCGNRLLILGGPRSYNGGCLEIYGWEPREGFAPEWTLLGMKPFGNFVFNCTVMGC